jgi:hypothetical protein
LKGKALTSIEDLKYVQGKSCGGLIVVKDIAKRLGIINALGSNKEGQLALLYIPEHPDPSFRSMLTPHSGAC